MQTLKYDSLNFVDFVKTPSSLTHGLQATLTQLGSDDSVNVTVAFEIQTCNLLKCSVDLIGVNIPNGTYLLKVVSSLSGEPQYSKTVMVEGNDTVLNYIVKDSV